MSSIYHIVERKPVGDVLYPLAGVRDINQELYSNLMSKYQGREKVLSMVISQLNCRWDEVLHMSPVHPSKLSDVLAGAGLNRKFLYYEIDPTTLDQNNLILYPNTYRDEDKIYNLEAKDFVEFNSSDLNKWAYIPQKTVEYYKQRIREGKQFLTFRNIPHILYKGSIDVSNLELKNTNSF